MTLNYNYPLMFPISYMPKVFCQVSPENVLEAIDILSQAACNISDWADGASLLLNHGKTKAILFGTNTFVNHISNFNLPGINLGNGIVNPFVNEMKGLVVILDNRLNWDSHIKSIEKKGQSSTLLPQIHTTLHNKKTTNTTCTITGLAPILITALWSI